MILDCLTEDKESLVRCSLVCKNWVPRSRRHLWKRIKLDCAEDNGDQVPTFADAISCSPSLASSIQAFILRGFDDDSTRESPYGAIIPLLCLMPKLQELLLDQVSFDEFKERSARLELCPSLRRLSLKSTTFESMGDFHRFQQSFASLRELSMDELVGWGDLTEYTGCAKSLSLELDFLEIGFDDNEQTTISWLALLQSISVGTFRVAGMVPRVFYQAVPFVRKAWKACISSASILELDSTRIACAGCYCHIRRHVLLTSTMITGMEIGRAHV